MKKSIISILLSVLLVLAVMPAAAVTAFAENSTGEQEPYSYYDENGEVQYAEYYVKMTSNEAVDSYIFKPGKWYVVQGTFTVTDRIVNNAPADDPAHIILGYGCVFNALQGIYNPEGKGLVIYTHSVGSGEGMLNAATSDSHIADAAIGGNAAEEKRCGDLTVNGGRITAEAGGYGGAGIGGGFRGGCGSVVINGGTVYASAGDNVGGAGIGGGDASKIGSGVITVNGGTVTAVGGSYGGAGIGGGYGGTVEKVTVNGGTVTATGGSLCGAGIGNGFVAEAGAAESTIIINGGKVTATGGAGSAGIGGASNYPGEPGSKVDNITITGGEITAVGTDAPAIGGGQFCQSCGTTTIGDRLEILAGYSEEECYYLNNGLYLLSLAPYAYIHAVPTYTVKHLKQKADGTGYEAAETETKSGHTGEYTAAAFKDYDGFIPQCFEQQTVKKDGSSVVEIYYDRIKPSETELETAKQLEEALAAIADLEKRLEEKQAELAKLNEESNEAVAALNAEIESLNSQLDAAKKEIERLKAQSGDPGAGEGDGNTCPECGKVHADNFFGRIVCFFNRIGNFFRNLFK